jgi:outer membrane protein OmpA-like peptidoglycan-associated protein
MKRAQSALLVAVAAVGVVSAGCAKKKVATVTPPAPAPAVSTPTATPRPTPPQERAAATPAPAASAPASTYPDAKTRARIDELLAKIEDAYFDYNKASLRPDAITISRWAIGARRRRRGTW